MTIEQKRDSYVVHCDTCPNYFEDETLDFNDFVKLFKIQGWITYKDEDDRLVNKCPVCREDRK